MPRIEELLNESQIKEVYSKATNENSNTETRSAVVEKSKFTDILDQNPELKAKIIDVFKTISSIPAIHITSREFRNGKEVIESTFVNDILKNGLRAKDTNVGVFMERTGKRRVASPDFYEAHPEKFLQELETLLKHYYHHGTRTNKNLLGKELNSFRGVPVMLLVNVDQQNLIPGTDYEDHYIIKNSISGENIFLPIDLENENFQIKTLVEIANNILDAIQSKTN